MKLNVFSAYDEKAQVFLQPMFLVHQQEAVRSFKDEVAKPNSMLGRHPEDFKLYKLGSYNDSTGKLESLDVPELINNATDFVETTSKKEEEEVKV